MSNSTSSEGPDAIYYTLVVSALQGLVIVPPNLLVVLAILRYQALRGEKEYILMMGQSLADALNMLAYGTSGVYRLYIIHSNRVASMVASRQCLVVPHVILWSFADINAMLMLVFISVDRVLCTAYPLKYIKLTRSYARNLVICCYSFTILMGGLGYVLIYNQEQEPVHSALCKVAFLFDSNTRFGQIYNQYWRNAPQVSMALSILLYAFVPPIYSYQKKKMGKVSGDQKTKMDFQRKINKTFAIACFFTFWVALVPYRLAYVVLEWGEEFLGLTYALFLFSNLNSLVNLIVYRVRHAEVQVAVKGMLTGKILPPVVRLWNTGHN